MKTDAPPFSPPETDADVFVMPVSVAQKRFWMLEQMSPGNTALNIPIALRLTGPLDAEVLARALQAIVDRHEILRTRFEPIDGEPRQVIAARAEIALRRLRLGPVPSEQTTDRIRQEMDREVGRPLDFTRAPLLRATLVELAPADNVLMLTAHHIVSDGWSNGVLVRELAAFYESILHGKPHGLPPLAIQYADYVVWQEQWLQTPAYRKQIDYWRQTLEGDLPVLDFPTDFARHAAAVSTQAVLESRLLPGVLGDALRRFCRDEGVTLFMVFAAAYAVLLHRYTGQDRIVIGTTSANRSKPELEPLVGLFANLLVLATDVSGDLTFREFLLRQRDRALTAFAHHEAPFEHLVAERDGRRLALQTHFLFQRAFMQPTEVGDLAFNPLHSVSPGSTFELTFGIVERQEGIRLQMEYRTSLFRAATIRRLLHHFQRLLEAALRDPKTKLDDLDLFAGDERETLWGRLTPARPGSAEGTGALDPGKIVDDLDRQMERHLQGASRENFATPVALPPGCALVALDGSHRLLPIGIPGELFLVLPEGTPGVGTLRGPVESSPLRPLYPTGFLGRNGEGGAELWGLAGDFIRVQGFRFNLLAVAAQLRAHPDVAEVAVTLHPQPLGLTRLVAHVVPRDDVRMNTETLRHFLKGKISDYLQPASIRVVPALPRGEEGELLPAQLEATAVALLDPASESLPLQAHLHLQLLEVWQRLLKRTDLAIDDNFFEAGGNSFLALKMMLEVEKLCGRPLPLSLLLTGATVADLAHAIVEGNRESGATVAMISVQPKGTRPPLFFLHGDWVGGGFYCHRLARELGEDQPFYALPPFSMQEPKISTMTEMADWHRRAIQEKFPHGPYVLGGYCIGATVAGEVARLLVARGEVVSHLFLIDPPLWGSVGLRGLWPWFEAWGDLREWDLDRKIRFFDRTVVAFNRWLRRPFHEKFASIARRLGLRASAKNTVFPQDDRPDGLGEADILDGLDFETYYMTYRLHRPSLLSVPATLLLPETTSAPRRAEALGRSRLDPAKSRVEIVRGNHTTCVTRHPGDLAAILGKLLDSAAGKTTSS